MINKSINSVLCVSIVFVLGYWAYLDTQKIYRPSNVILTVLVIAI